LVRIEASAFCGSGLNAIIIPSSVEILGEKCFFNCGLLQSVTFDPQSRLRELGKDAFTGISISPILPVSRFGMLQQRSCCVISQGGSQSAAMIFLNACLMILALRLLLLSLLS
jgi:hypothetical protein